MNDETKSTLPKGVDQKLYDTASEIILSGFENKQEPDVIKSAMFGEGIPFSKLSRIWSAVTKENDLVRSAADITLDITDEVNDADLQFDEDFDTISELIDNILKEVVGSTKSRVKSIIKTQFVENEKEFPRKSSTKRGRMGNLNKTMANVFAANKEATQEDLFNALKEVTKTEKNALDYSKSYYKLLYAVANGFTALEVLTVLGKKEVAAK